MRNVFWKYSAEVFCVYVGFTVGEVRATNSDLVSKTTGQWHPTQGLRYRAVCRCCWPMKRSSSRVPPSDSAWTLRGTCTWSASGCWGGLRWRAQSSEWFPTLKTQSTTQTTSPRCISKYDNILSYSWIENWMKTTHKATTLTVAFWQLLAERMTIWYRRVFF